MRWILDTIRKHRAAWGSLGVGVQKEGLKPITGTKVATRLPSVRASELNRFTASASASASAWPLFSAPQFRLLRSFVFIIQIQLAFICCPAASGSVCDRSIQGQEDTTRRRALITEITETKTCLQIINLSTKNMQQQK